MSWRQWNEVLIPYVSKVWINHSLFFFLFLSNVKYEILIIGIIGGRSKIIHHISSVKENNLFAFIYNPLLLLRDVLKKGFSISYNLSRWLTFTGYFFPSEKITSKCTMKFSRRDNSRATLWRRRWQDFWKILVRGWAAETLPSRALQIFPLKSAPEFTCVGRRRREIGSTHDAVSRTWRREKERNKTVNGRRGARREKGTEQESERRKGGYIGRNIYEESSSMHPPPPPHPKVASGCALVCVCVCDAGRGGGRVSHVLRACVRVNVCETRVVCARVSAYVKRDVATQAGMQFRNVRVAHEANPALLYHVPAPSPFSSSHPLLVTGRNEGRGRWRLPGRNSLEFPGRTFSAFLHVEFYPRPVLSHLCVRETTLCSRLPSDCEKLLASDSSYIHLRACTMLITHAYHERIKIIFIAC